MKASPFQQRLAYPDLLAATTRMQGIVKRLKYKPGWTLKADLSPDGQAVEVQLFVMVQDSAGHSDTDIEICRSMSFYWQYLAQASDDILIRHIFSNLIMGMERHEAEEWFRADGVVVYDPHEGEAG